MCCTLLLLFPLEVLYVWAQMQFNKKTLMCFFPLLLYNDALQSVSAAHVFVLWLTFVLSISVMLCCDMVKKKKVWKKYSSTKLLFFISFVRLSLHWNRKKRRSEEKKSFITRFRTKQLLFRLLCDLTALGRFYCLYLIFFVILDWGKKKFCALLIFFGDAIFCSLEIWVKSFCKVKIINNFLSEAWKEKN